ncbi:hypothetical protein SLS62_009348 [Diatrype stigma]|uniref:Ubiquitin-like protease family profile domain-containing protein n=1 Tax=Diatrype stigma TaxID=117547 RepID=A0AAN9UGL1_9PEZI
MDLKDIRLQYTSSQVVCRSRTECEIEHLDLPEKEEYPALSDTAWDAGRLLSQLQYSRTSVVTWESMRIALDAYRQTLPVAVQHQILVHVGNYPHIFGNTGRDHADWTRDCERSLGFFATSFASYEYVIWPLSNEHNHWVTAIIRMAKERSSDKTRNHVAQIALIDPLRDQHSARRVGLFKARLLLILRQTMHFSLGPSATRWQDVWTPTQHSDVNNSSGPRAYWTCKETMRRVLELYEAGIGYHESLWNDHSGWFHDAMVRQEIIGSHAWLAIEGMDYRGRVAVEAINRVRKDRDSPWEEASERMRPGPAFDPPREPQKPDQSKKIPVGSKDPTAHIQRRPVFALPPRGEPRINPLFSMRKGDGKKEYCGWTKAPGRNVFWNHPRRTWPKPPISPPPGQTTAPKQPYPRNLTGSLF